MLPGKEGSPIAEAEWLGCTKVTVSIYVDRADRFPLLFPPFLGFPNCSDFGTLFQCQRNCSSGCTVGSFMRMNGLTCIAIQGEELGHSHRGE
jgi:hypothetical protein